MQKPYMIRHRDYCAFESMAAQMDLCVTGLTARDPNADPELTVDVVTLEQVLTGWRDTIRRILSDVATDELYPAHWDNEPVRTAS